MGSKTHHSGVIKQIEGELVYVKIIQQSACAGCHVKSMCSTADSKEKIVEVIDSRAQSYHIGQPVVIVGESSLGLLAVFLAFGMPIILILSVLVLVTTILSDVENNESLAAVAALLVLTVWYVLLYAKRDLLKRKFVFNLKN